MKQKTTLNYLVIIFSWCFFLNRLEIVSYLLLTISSIILFVSNDKLNLTRFLMTLLLFIISLNILIKVSNLDYFYPSIKNMSIMISFNLAVLNETQSLLNIQNLFSFFSSSLIVTLLFIFVALVLPDSLYPIFTKIHLYSLISLIFLPYLFELTFLIGKKIINNNPHV